MRRAAVAIALACAGTLLAPRGAAAEVTSFVHVVRPAETLASIAQRYYGDPRRESVLVAENGLNVQGGAAIVVGMRLVVPWVAHHRVAEGETWSELATLYYGDARRVFLLVEHNGGSMGDQPDLGAELVVPYPLRHVASQTDNVRRVAELYYGPGEEGVRTIRRFNGLRGNRLVRGQVVLVPLVDLVLSEEGRAVIGEATGHGVSAGEVRSLQQRIDAELPALREHARRGRYAEAVSLGNRLLGAGDLTGNQIVTIERELGTAYVALGRDDLAAAAYREALRLQPDLELDVARTSPLVMRAFRRAKDEHERTGSARGGDGGAPADAGVDAGP